MVGLKLTLLGGFDARLPSGRPLSLSTKKGQALLAYLGTRPGESHSRHKLAALLWGEKRDDQARGGLRHALVALRRALAGARPSPLRIGGQTLVLDPGAAEVDVATFERRVAVGTPRALEQAAELYRGDLLFGFHLNEPLFEEWLVAERERLRELAVEALGRLLTHQSKAAASERAIQTAMRLLGLDPLQEAVHRTLMRLYARQGRRGAALKQYQLCVDVLQRELGTAPEAETKQLYQDLLRRPAEVPEAPGGRRARPTRTVGAVAPSLPAAETPLFGRQGHLEALRQRLEKAIRGRGQIATVVGEAGIGKTRLVTTLVADALAQGCRVLIGHCHESDSILPFGPWVDACRNGQISSDEELLGALHPKSRVELTRLLPEASTAGPPPASDSALPLFESVTQLIERVATHQPLVLVLEDLHWVDEMSLRLLAFVSRRIPAWRALLITTAREEELTERSLAQRTVKDLSRLPHGMGVALPPLSRSDTVRLMRALTGGESDAQAVTDVEERIWVMSEGNPFVVVEAMRAVGQKSSGDDASEAPRALALPAQVRELVARRLDRLSAGSQQVAAVASVIGRRFDFDLLQSASGLDERAAAEAVEEMARHHVLEAVGNELDFAHDRIREIVYGRLLPPRQRSLHRAVAEALAVRGGTAGGIEAHRDHAREHVEQLAHHTLRGEVWEKAWRYCWQAGAKAAGRVANREAVAFFKQALATLEHLPETRVTREHAIDLLVDLSNALQVLGDLSQSFDCIRRAETLAAAFGDRRRLFGIAAKVTSRFWQAAEQDRALEVARPNLALANDLDDPIRQAHARYHVGRIHHVMGDYQLAIEVLRTSTEALKGSAQPEEFWPRLSTFPSVNSRANLALCLAEVGEFAEAVVRGEEARQIAEEIDHPYSRIVACVGLGGVWLRQTDFARAVAVLETGFHLCEELQIPVLFPWIAAPWAYASAFAGRVADARPVLALAVERAAAMRLLVYQSQRIAWLSEISLLSGRRDDAVRLGERALDLARTYKERGHEAWALRVLGKIHLPRGSSGGRLADDYYRQALAIAEELGMRPLQADCHLALGRLYRRSGRRADSNDNVTKAMAMFREMDMPLGSERTAVDGDE
jgi:DNA-binding SARP family transcriptional activator